MKKYLVVGLGNPGNQYDNTRHNIGFKVLDRLVQQDKKEYQQIKHGIGTAINHKGRHALLVKPGTFMNRSGKAVKYHLDRNDIPLKNLLVITDDLNLPFGTLRLKTKGSDGGHNGLKDIQQALGTQNYARLRFGISADFKQGGQIDYVLESWEENEMRELPALVERCTEAIRSFMFAGPANTMDGYNKDFLE